MIYIAYFFVGLGAIYVLSIKVTPGWYARDAGVAESTARALQLAVCPPDLGLVGEMPTCAALGAAASLPPPLPPLYSDLASV